LPKLSVVVSQFVPEGGFHFPLIFHDIVIVSGQSWDWNFVLQVKIFFIFVILKPL